MKLHFTHRRLMQSCAPLLRIVRPRVRLRLLAFAGAFALAACAIPPNGTDQAETTHGNAGMFATSKTQPDVGSTFAAAPDAASAPAAPESKLDGKPLTASAPDISSFAQNGRASWYGPRFDGRKTASGERYNMNAMTAAHRTLPMSAYVRVTNIQNNKSVVVKINDRGPFYRGRIIDLSRAAALALGMQHAGTGAVKLQGLSSAEALAAQTESLAMR
jgi:rare lipoprotein A